MKLYITEDELKLQIKRRNAITILVVIIAVLIALTITSVLHVEGDMLRLKNVNSLQTLEAVSKSDVEFFKITVDKVIITNKTVGMIEQNKETFGSFAIIELDNKNVVLLLPASEVRQLEVKNNVGNFKFIASISKDTKKSEEIIKELTEKYDLSNNKPFESILECGKYTIADTIFSLVVLLIALLAFLALGVWNFSRLFELLADKKRRKNEQQK